MIDDNKQNKNAILAVVLSGIILFGWSYFFAPTQPYDVTPTKELNTAETKNGSNSSVNNVSADSNPELSTDRNLTTVDFKNDNVVISIDNYLNVTEYLASNSKLSINDALVAPKTRIIVDNTEIFFNFSNKTNNSVDVVSTDGKLSGTISLTDKNSLNVALNSSAPINLGFMVSSTERNVDNQTFNQFVYLADSLEPIHVGETSDSVDSKVTWFGLDFNYHLFAFFFPVSDLYRVGITATESASRDSDGDAILNGTLFLNRVTAASVFNYDILFMKKNYDSLAAYDDKLKLAVDFGIWSIIALPILRGLQIFYDFFQNYGLAIIFLTILIRFLTFPLQYKSFQSMKKMQVVQPEIAKIKEKYKDDPKKMQTETMALFKKAGANPIGGCLPMILQMPIFFAFYKVLYTSVELVDAPFYFWILDLSAKDPYYVLPVLMGLAMFLNMKLTPSTSMDPAQQKVMMLMPIMFTFFMVNLPSGLTLYILVSTIVGMLQQLFVYKRTT